MIIDVSIPNQGLTITEATLVRWCKRPGDRVAAGETLFEIETDKAVQEIESPASGSVLALFADEGEVVPLGKVVARIGTEAGERAEVRGGEGERGRGGDKRQAAGGTRQEAKTSELGTRNVERPRPLATHETKPLPRFRQGDVTASPRARRVAAELVVELAAVEPTGAGGRHIVERDVMRASIAEPSPARLVPYSIIQQPIVLIREIDATRLESILEELAQLEPETGAHITAAVLLERAVSRALRSAPRDILPGSITVHDFGPYGIDQAFAPVEPEQAASLSIGVIKPRPFEIDSRLALCPTMILALTVDVSKLGVDQASELLSSICGLLDRPLSLLT